MIYKITNNIDGNVYIGKHKTNDKNDGYMGSGLYLRHAQEKYGIENFTKEILFECSSEEEMDKKERELVNEDFVKRDDTYNIALGGNDALYQLTQDGSNVLRHTSKGHVTVVDKNGNTFSVLKTDSRYINGDVVSFNTGKVIAFDKIKNKNVIVSKEEYHNNKERYIGVTTGNVSVKDIDGNIHYVSVNDERYLSGKLIPLWYGRKHTDETKQKISDALSKASKGEGNSQYGTKWIHNNSLRKNKKINKDCLLEEGWEDGRILDWSFLDKTCSVCGCNLGLSKKSKRTKCESCKKKELNKNKKEEYNFYYPMYEDYKKYGWQYVKDKYEYPYSHPNFIQRIKKLFQ